MRVFCGVAFQQQGFGNRLVGGMKASSRRAARTSCITETAAPVTATTKGADSARTADLTEHVLP
jgi:hypothetical protein